MSVHRLNELVRLAHALAAHRLTTPTAAEVADDAVLLLADAQTYRPPFGANPHTDAARDRDKLTFTDAQSAVEMGARSPERCLSSLAGSLYEWRVLSTMRPVLALLAVADTVDEEQAVNALRAYREAMHPGHRVQAIGDVLTALVEGIRIARYAPGDKIRRCRRCRGVLAPDAERCSDCGMKVPRRAARRR